MRRRGFGRRKAVIAFVGLVCALFMIAPVHADYRTLYGDGQWHEIAGGWWYAYNTSLNDCYWRYEGVIRFAYDYDNGQWWDYGTSWGTLGATGFETDDFIGDGVWHSLNNGWSFAYNKAVADSYWRTGSGEDRFAYDYDNGQWWDYCTAWYQLGPSGVSQSFIGDGAWHTMANGWSYAYNKALDDAYWNTGSAVRFAYDYDGNLWWHYGSSWSPLALYGWASNCFIGDGAWHDLGDGWSFAYNKALDDAYWNDSYGATLAYDYDDGQWYHSGYGGSWFTLGASNLTADFLGDGDYHTLGNGFFYNYNRYEGYSYGYFLVGWESLFCYEYSSGQWWNKGNSGSWAELGDPGHNAAFIGDGSIHDLFNGWSYVYGAGTGSLYNNDAEAWRFMYNYTLGQWYHKGDYGDWNVLGDSDLSAEFVGDGSVHYLGHDLHYQYTSGDVGQWSEGEAHPLMRFSYDYHAGQWFHYYGGASDELGTSGKSSLFLGDGGLHDLGNGFSYYYYGSWGYWLVGGDYRFMYDYSHGQWNLWHTALSDWQELSPEGTVVDFIGDGSVHSFGTDYYWNMQYTGDTVLINVWTDTDTTQRNYLRYVYGTGGTGWWQDRNVGYDWRNLNGYRLDYEDAGRLVFDADKAGYTYDMTLLFGTNHYDGLQVVALYTDPSVGAGYQSYLHDYLSNWWYANSAGVGEEPDWTADTQGATNLHRP